MNIQKRRCNCKEFGAWRVELEVSCQQTTIFFALFPRIIPMFLPVQHDFAPTLGLIEGAVGASDNVFLPFIVTGGRHSQTDGQMRLAGIPLLKPMAPNRPVARQSRKHSGTVGVTGRPDPAQLRQVSVWAGGGQFGGVSYNFCLYNYLGISCLVPACLEFYFSCSRGSEYDKRLQDITPFPRGLTPPPAGNGAISAPFPWRR